MAENDNRTTGAETPAEKPAKSSQKAINEDYAKATPKERAKKFTVDPVTKTLRRA